ncbi:MAG: hypothetical protein JF595_06770 [Sphingomonadales bacterium]|nr:hypothetical protein [Sphingomonadales bacterium]
MTREFVRFAQSRRSLLASGLLCGFGLTACRTAGVGEVTGANLLLALFSEEETTAVPILRENGMNRRDVLKAIGRSRPGWFRATGRNRRNPKSILLKAVRNPVANAVKSNRPAGPGPGAKREDGERAWA